MARLARSDLDALLSFAAEAAELSEGTGLTTDILARIVEFIPSDAITYSEIDLVAHEWLYGIGFPEIPGVDLPPDRFWEVLAENPICVRDAATGTLGPTTFSDVMSDVAFRRTEFYEFFVRPNGLRREIGIRLPPVGSVTRHLHLSRTLRDYTDRHRLMLDRLRPFLVGIQARGRRADAEAPPSVETRTELTATPISALTVREREILAHVALGRTNAQIAETLWISPGTVRKHLENIFVKLEVRNRTTAVARLAASQSHTEQVPLG